MTFCHCLVWLSVSLSVGVCVSALSHRSQSDSLSHSRHNDSWGAVVCGDRPYCLIHCGHFESLGVTDSALSRGVWLRRTANFCGSAAKVAGGSEVAPSSRVRAWEAVGFAEGACVAPAVVCGWRRRSGRPTCMHRRCGGSWTDAWKARRRRAHPSRQNTHAAHSCPGCCC